MTLSRLRKEMFVTVHKLRSKHDNVTVPYQKLLVSICCIYKARKEIKSKAVYTFINSRNVYDDGRKVTVEAHEAE